MKKRMLLAALVLAAVVATPEAAAAQCNQKCVTLTNEAGEVAGYGCAVQEGSGKSCISTAYRCNQQTCSNALLTDGEGGAVDVLRRCADESSRTASRAAKPTRGRPTRTPHAPPTPVLAAAAGDEIHADAAG